MKRYLANLTKYVSICSIMMALSFVLNRYVSISSTWFRIGISSTPIVITSILFGPLWGGLVGLGSDLLAAFLVPQGAYFIGYSIDTTLMGVLPWLSLRLFKGLSKTKFVIYAILVAVTCAISIAFCSEFDVFKKQNLELYIRILIPIGVAIYYVILFVIYQFILKKQGRFKVFVREDEKYSLSDIYLAIFINHSIISLFLLPAWNLITVEINYLLTSFTQVIIFLVSGLVNSLIVYFVINSIIQSKILSWVKLKKYNLPTKK